jgi:hypothetical protein
MPSSATVALLAVAQSSRMHARIGMFVMALLHLVPDRITLIVAPPAGHAIAEM